MSSAESAMPTRWTRSSSAPSDSAAAAPINTSTETLEEFAKLWWSRHVAPNLARHTQESYASVLDVHLIPRIGDYRLSQLTVEVISDLRAEMAADGVGDPPSAKR